MILNRLLSIVPSQGPLISAMRIHTELLYSKDHVPRTVC